MPSSSRVLVTHGRTFATLVAVVLLVQLLPVMSSAAPQRTEGVWRDDVVFPSDMSEADALELLGAERLRRYEAQLERELIAIAPPEIAGALPNVRVRISCVERSARDARCPLGTVEVHDRWVATIHLSPVALNVTDDVRRALLAHELAHVWQFGLTGAHVDPVADGEALVPDAGSVSRAGVVPRAIELEADCIAEVWGHPWPQTQPFVGYWRCSDEALQAVRSAWSAWVRSTDLDALRP